MEDFINELLDKFLKWREEKGYEKFVSMLKNYDKKEVENRFWEDFNKYKNERLSK